MGERSWHKQARMSGFSGSVTEEANTDEKCPVSGDCPTDPLDSKATSARDETSSGISNTKYTSSCALDLVLAGPCGIIILQEPLDSLVQSYCVKLQHV